ncbi:MAG: NFACT family protein [Armatimonadota bacterium]
MLFDSTILAAITREVAEALLGARVSAVRQPHFARVYLDFGGRGVLLASSAPDDARVHLTTEAPEATRRPLPFCSALRRHLVRARLDAVEQVDFDRVLWLRFSECEGHGPECRRALVIEIMGRHSNMILVDESRGDGRPTILACAKHVTHKVNRYRQILPGEAYVPPPASERRDPRRLTPDDVSAILDACPGPVERALAKLLAGASPTFIAEIVHRAGLGPEDMGDSLSSEDVAQIARAASEVACATGAFVHLPQSPTEKALAYPAPLEHLAQTHRAEPRDSMSAALQELAISAQEAVTRARLKAGLISAVESALRRAESRAASRRRELDSAGDYDAHRRVGEAIINNVHRIPQGAARATLVDYGSPDQRTLDVELDPTLSPADNARRHFEAYRRGKRIAARLPGLIAEAQAEADYLSRMLARVESLDEIAALRDVEAELTSRGYLTGARRERRRRDRPSKPSEPEVGRLYSHGCTIRYGRNEAQNEHLLRRRAAPDDVWLHVRGAPSGHVIIKCPGTGDPPREVLVQAARLAARNSALRRDGAVEVDYTLRKHVTKPKGAPPGFVRYTHAKTIVVKP